MDFITLFIILLAFALIIVVLRSIKPMEENGDGLSLRAEHQEQDPHSGEYSADQPFVPEIGLTRLVARLPEEYWEYFEHPSDEPYIIPQTNSIVGYLRMLFVWREAIVQVGKHTELRFETMEMAFEFVDKVLRDEIVFRMGDEETSICPIEDFEGPGEADRNDYVWSGPLKYKLLFRS